MSHPVSIGNVFISYKTVGLTRNVNAEINRLLLVSVLEFPGYDTKLRQMVGFQF